MIKRFKPHLLIVWTLAFIVGSAMAIDSIGLIAIAIVIVLATVIAVVIAIAIAVDVIVSATEAEIVIGGGAGCLSGVRLAG